MAESKHTPGPWRVDPEHEYDIESADGHFQIAMARDDACHLLLDRQYAPVPSEAEANARLIAAAPEMLDLLKLFERDCDYQMQRLAKAGDDEGARLRSFTLHQIRQVLAKAERASC